jgi:hypothetical protein
MVTSETAHFDKQQQRPILSNYIYLTTVSEVTISLDNLQTMLPQVTACDIFGVSAGLNAIHELILVNQDAQCHDGKEN